MHGFPCFSGMPDGTSEAPIEYKKYIQRINLFPNQPPIIHLKKMDAKKQLMKALNLPYEDTIAEDTDTTETTEVE